MSKNICKVIGKSIVALKDNCITSFVLEEETYSESVLRGARSNYLQTALRDSLSSRWGSMVANSQAISFVNKKYNKEYQSIGDYLADYSLKEDYLDILALLVRDTYAISVRDENVFALKVKYISPSRCLDVFGTSEIDSMVLNRFISIYSGWDKTPNVWKEIIDDILSRNASEDFSLDYLERKISEYTYKLEDYSLMDRHRELIKLIS